MRLRIRFVHWNDDYLEIRTGITRNIRRWNGMTIPIHSFGAHSLSCYVLITSSNFLQILQFHKYPPVCPTSKKVLREPRTKIEIFLLWIQMLKQLFPISYRQNFLRYRSQIYQFIVSYALLWNCVVIYEFNGDLWAPLSMSFKH